MLNWKKLFSAQERSDDLQLQLEGKRAKSWLRIVSFKLLFEHFP